MDCGPTACQHWEDKLQVVLMWKMVLVSIRKGKNESGGGAWVPQSVKRPTLGFGSGRDLTVHEFEPCIRLCADRVGPAQDSLCPSLSLPLPCSLVRSLSLKINK